MAHAETLISVWDFRSEFFNSCSLNSKVSRLSADNSLLAIAFNDVLVLWNLNKGTKVKVLELEDINDVRFSPDGTKIVIGLYTGDVYKIDLQEQSDSSEAENAIE